MKRIAGESPGFGLFPLYSMINHSCLANCRYEVALDNHTMTVRAAREIPEGQEITIQYKDPLLGSVDTIPSFRNHWMFVCQCKRCLDPTELGTYLSAINCPGIYF